MFLSISIKTIVLKFIVTQINEGDFSFNWKFLKKIIDCGKLYKVIRFQRNISSILILTNINLN